MLIRLHATAVALALALAAGCATAPASRTPEPALAAPAAASKANGPMATVSPAATTNAPAAVTPPTPVKAPAMTAATGAPAAKVLPPPVLVERKPAPKAKAPVAVKAPVPVVANTQAISGRLDLIAGPRQKVASDEITQGLVYFLPEGGAPAPKPGKFTVSTHSKGFTPDHLVVPVGSTVSFPNRDTILHNVYSRTPGSTFDLGTFSPGESRQAVLKKAGLVIVNCNVHHTMRVNVVVLATPYYTRPRRDGSFQLKDIPVGPGTLVFWHPRANAGTLAIEGGRSKPVVQRLVATKARLEAHAAAGN